jgi:pimeloyl-ACP methyl ester carboxylesterase
MNLNVIVTEPSGTEEPTPIIFIHGAWHGAWCWTQHFTEFFADNGYRSFTLDLRGHGESGGSVRATRITHYVHDVRRLALELDSEPIIIGHSMGGFVVQHYLVRYRAAAGVLMAPCPTVGAIGATMRVILDHPLAFLRANVSLSLGPIVDDPQRASALLFGPRMNQADASAYAERLQNESYPAYLEMIFDHPRASRVEDPILVLGAQCDSIFSPREIRGTARAYNTEAIMFDDMGHDMMLEPGWERPAEAILSWLKLAT